MTQRISRLGKIVGMGLLGLTALAGPVLSGEKPQRDDEKSQVLEKRLQESEDKEGENSIWASSLDFEPSVYIQSSMVSDYVGKHGFVLPGEVRQDLVNININDRISGFIWENFDYDKGQFNERDYGVYYSIPLDSDGNINARVGHERWTYPNGDFGDHDNVFKAGLNYSGFINSDFEVTHLLAHGGHESGDRFYLEASKPFTIYDGGFNISITPGVKAAVTDNYYGESGFRHVTPNVSFDVTKGNFNFGIFVNEQIGVEKAENKTWGGASIGYSF